ncbi:hypothetical protein C474_18885 [Halogeometricum pallidum JCM 14848]|uniref:Pyrrolo-quinoline quinone repeat domain-containing protein n=1 Tax=Halogeometricum pallidum JCM 14848 TaxID=1227487 RepID=M0CU43_HALPD|nr:PQQ-binding-like beta-propeller repeat protein [Halogeometricum pallidum]ELZ26736.1 hypothetical protein C474_18885 [Halogeometricum pallidum JCM 14848]
MSRDDGAWKWGTYGRDQTPAAGLPRAAALAPDSLYTADGRYARAFDRDGTFRWQTAYPENSGGEARIYGVLPTGDGVLLGGHGRLSVFDSNGDYQWTFADTGGSGATYPALAADELYVAGPGPLLSLSPRSSPESLLGRPPSTEWVSDAPGGPTWPVVTDEYVVLGDTDRAGGGRTRGNLHVYRRDGTHVRSISSDGGHSHLAVASDQSAVLYGTGVFGDVEGTVTALDLSSGETRWTREDLSVAEWGTSLVVAGDTCLFAEATDGHSARVHALDVATGETRWVLATERTPEALIVAGSQVYLATAGGLVAYE